MIPTPSASFEPGGKKRSAADYAKKQLKGAEAAVAFVMMTTVIMYLFGIIRSVNSKIFLDRLLTEKNPEWLRPFILALLGFAALQLIVAWIQTIYTLKINGK